MAYRAVYSEEEGYSVILDDYGLSVASIHSDGKTITPVFEPELATLIADLLNKHHQEAPLALAA